MGYNSSIKLTVLLSLLIISVVIATWSYHANIISLGFISTAIIIILIAMIIKLHGYTAKKVAFMFDSINNDDFSFRFSSTSKNNQSDQLLNDALNRIKTLVLQARQEARERERYFETILEQVSTGIVVINPKGIVFKTNQEALKLLQISQLSHIDQLSIIDKDIPKQFIDLDDGESTMIRYYDEASMVNLSITATNVVLQEKPLKIICITDIGTDINSTELESWNRISRVLTHEIMNSLTPITTLSQTLREISDPNAIKHGLEIINSTAEDLMTFIDNYRLLTRIPKPIPENFDIIDLLNQEIALTNKTIEIKHNSIQTNIYADKGLISQVIKNLLKNGIEAISSSQNSEATMWIEIGLNNKGRIFISFCNNGDPISDEIRNNIFVPFFTTKEHGNGIGLSLSRQIMQLHNGYINLSTSPITRFSIQF